MSYQALARKWRPQMFSSFVGQPATVTALTHALSHHKIHHAYLFTGTRGVGKTSLARILAKCLNCEQGVSSTPCGQCDSCLSIAKGNAVDLLEIDAASRTKVEDTRELLDQVPYLPTQSRYKIYLIDEVHMLSKHSFNALLKTLEEPPSHVIFLLATTDVHKLPATVLSRCLQFHLRHVSPDDIATHLKSILKQESITFEEQAISLIATHAKGSLRDALTLLEQVIHAGNGKASLDAAKLMLGVIDRDFIIQILKAIAHKNTPELLSLTAQCAADGVNFEQVLNDILVNLFELTKIQCLGLSDKHVLSDLAALIKPEKAQLYYDIALNGLSQLPIVQNQTVGFEMILLKMMHFEPVFISATTQQQADENAANLSFAKTAPHLPTEEEKKSVVKAPDRENIAQKKETLQKPTPKMPAPKHQKAQNPAEQLKAAILSGEKIPRVDLSAQKAKINDLKSKAATLPQVKALLDTFDATVTNVTPTTGEKNG